jgi:Zn-dependent protease with chaperone function
MPLRHPCVRGHAVGHSAKEQNMVTILIVLAVLMLLGAIPTWPHSRNWGYGPSGGLGLVLLIVVILLLTGRI